MSSDLLHPELWTNGAQRLLRRAAQLARLHEDAQVDLVHLLWALLVDEGRAGATLSEAGVTLAALNNHHRQLAATEVEQLADLDPLSTWAAVATDVIREARHIGYQTEAAAETGTHHLLSAFLASEITVSMPGLAEVRRQEQVAALPVVLESENDLEPLAVPAEMRGELALRVRAEPNLSELYRILDAAANRAREGLRVVEDFTRFGVNDRFLSGELKAVRHELAAVLAEFPQVELLACRDTLGDVGTSLSAVGEYHRTDVQDVLAASFKRSQEALRTLEEYSKVVSGDLGRRLERLRYRLYTLEKAASMTLANRQRLANQHLYLLLTDAACPGGMLLVLKAALDAGIRLFQVREKTWSDRQLLQHCRELRKWTRERGALLIVNDRPDIAVLCEADGVHVGQDELSVAEAQRIIGPDRLIGVSTHSIEQARQAVLDGADYLGVGPTFSSQTKQFDDFPGLNFVSQVAAEISLPWFAIGGIHEHNLGDVLAAGAQRVAVTQVISASPNPHETSAAMLHRLRSHAESVTSATSPSPG